MFLTDNDYSHHQRDHDLTILTKGGDVSTRNFAEGAAQEEMASYLSMRYDIENIFNKIGTERNPLIVMRLVDMCVYHMYAKIPQRQTPQDVTDRYLDAIKWLEGIAKGRYKMNLPTIPATSQNIMYGSHKKLNNNW